MSRVGVEFGWPSRKTGQILVELGLRDGQGRPTLQGEVFSRKKPLAVAPDFVQWHLPSTRQYLQEAGYQPLGSQQLCSVVLHRYADMFHDRCTRYFSNTRQKKSHLARMNVELAQCLKALQQVQVHDKALILAALHSDLTNAGWLPSDILGVFKELGMSRHDVRATLIEAQTQPVTASTRRRML